MKSKFSRSAQNGITAILVMCKAKQNNGILVFFRQESFCTSLIYVRSHFVEGTRRAVARMFSFCGMSVPGLGRLQGDRSQVLIFVCQCQSVGYIILSLIHVLRTWRDGEAKSETFIAQARVLTFV